ncbi:hypothetical protein [Enhygromyxa salina]|uniref:hypothetical protein n=1 Tax=Enhygromyxa salina TaxID=215803 RepID=UPI000D092C29|nr:hypothetical protein [Enhygromyxa salina]
MSAASKSVVEVMDEIFMVFSCRVSVTPFGVGCVEGQGREFSVAPAESTADEPESAPTHASLAGTC